MSLLDLVGRQSWDTAGEWDPATGMAPRDPRAAALDLGAMDPGPLARETAPQADPHAGMSFLDKLSVGLQGANWGRLGPHSSPLEKAIVGLGSFGKGLLGTRARSVMERARGVEEMNQGAREEARHRNRVNEEARATNDAERRRAIIAAAKKAREDLAKKTADDAEFQRDHRAVTGPDGKPMYVPNATALAHMDDGKKPKEKAPKENLAIPVAARVAVDAAESQVKDARDGYRQAYWAKKFTDGRGKVNMDAMSLYGRNPIPPDEVPAMMASPEMKAGLARLRASRVAMALLTANSATTEDHTDEIVAMLDGWEYDTPGIKAEVLRALSTPKKKQ